MICQVIFLFSATAAVGRQETVQFWRPSLQIGRLFSCAAYVCFRSKADIVVSEMRPQFGPE